jgi:hypothetical protein
MMAYTRRVSLLRIRAAEQLFGLLPRQRKAVQGRPDGLATDAEAEVLAHERHQALEGEAGGRIGAVYGRRGHRTLGRTHELTETGRGPGAKGGRPPVRP